MIFKYSVLEARYTAMWNSSVVPADTQIKKMLGSRSFFRFDSASCIQSIEQYASTVKSILNNLIWDYNSFDDKDYVNEYIESTVSTFCSDFSKYSIGLERRLNQDSAIAAIDKLKHEIDVVITNHREQLMRATRVLDDDLDIELYPLPIQDPWLFNFNSYELTDTWAEESLSLGLADTWSNESIPFRVTDNLATIFTPFESTTDLDNRFIPFEGANLWASNTQHVHCGASPTLDQYDDDIDIDSYLNPCLR
ncbi:hypothetical protein [uncultured Legionella sp.]|uniref:hypothetical protein n=1 Tax=uncultured Legionella sp. TaxID=210934 RepID=UPI0026381C6D|nr:hypothetical protein [uncultured Legionella sp.]